MNKAMDKAMNRAITMDTPIGVLLLESNGSAIIHIELPGKETQAQAQAHARAPASEGETGEVLDRAVAQLQEYFDGDRTDFDLPLELEGTAFQKDVWLALADIPYGKTISYAELASMVGRPSAFRAVGQANGANPIPIVLPCHRVIASGGGIGGYGGGLDMKRRLLALEGVERIS
jgi:methylated-DNA-[protein]-cysteine S-methyltransferase